MTSRDTVIALQHLLNVAEDGAFGPASNAALQHLIAVANATPDAVWPAVRPPEGVHEVKASSFADPADVAAFRRCKDQGGSDQFCFSKGDNGRGVWGDDCTAGSGPAVALPPEDWQQFGSAARGKEVLVKANGQEVIAKLKDTMPHLANIKNGAGLDMNPDTCAALGLTPPVMVDAQWTWVDPATS